MKQSEWTEMPCCECGGAVFTFLGVDLTEEEAVAKFRCHDCLHVTRLNVAMEPLELLPSGTIGGRSVRSGVNAYPYGALSWHPLVRRLQLETRANPTVCKAQWERNRAENERR
jgi:hypothetical protein